MLAGVDETDGVDGGVLIPLIPREPFGEQLNAGKGDGILYLQNKMVGENTKKKKENDMNNIVMVEIKIYFWYRLCSSGTRPASIFSHCLAKWLTQRVQANTRFDPLSLPFRQGKCIACEFMCSALVDNHSI